MPDFACNNALSDESSEFQRYLTEQVPYAARVSRGFAATLDKYREETGNEHNVLFEIDHLERGVRTSTKPLVQFKHPPLNPFWHKHFHAPQHMLRNVGDHWGVSLGRPGNPRLDNMIREVARAEGNAPQRWQKLAAYRFIMGALDERSASGGITGDWIIIAKHGDKNYYLDLATHEEAKAEGGAADKLMEKLRAGCGIDFPFLF